MLVFGNCRCEAEGEEGTVGVGRRAIDRGYRPPRCSRLILCIQQHSWIVAESVEDS